MSRTPIHVFMAVENACLRNALLAALAPLECSPEVLMPQTLLQTELSGDNLIFLETSNDTDRLVSTAQQLWTTWGATGRANVRMISYSTRGVTSDSLVMRLWSIGPEMTVIVQAWHPVSLAKWQQYAHSYAQYSLQNWAQR